MNSNRSPDSLFREPAIGPHAGADGAEPPVQAPLVAAVPWSIALAIRADMQILAASVYRAAYEQAGRQMARARFRRASAQSQN